MSLLTGFIVFVILACIVGIGGYMLGIYADKSDPNYSADDYYEDAWDEDTWR